MRLLLLLLLLPTLHAAQSNFLKDPDIVWAAEIEQDWVVDISSLEEEWDKGIITLKQLRSRENELHWSSPYLAELVFEAVQRGDLIVFKDPECKIRTDAALAYRAMDTVVVFDPVSYEMQVEVVYSPPQPLKDVKAWRLRQILAYHKKSATWSTTVLSIAPLLEVKNWKGDSIGIQPIFWFKPDTKRQKLSSDRIVWAKKTVSGKQPKTEIPANPPNLVKALKGFENPVSHLLKVFQTNMKSPFYDSQGDKLLSLDERKNILPREDTTVSYNWETQEGTIDVEHKGITDSMIQQLRLVQTWFWDDRRARLSICLDAVAPLEEVVYIQYYRKSGGLKYTRPIFYRRAKY